MIDIDIEELIRLKEQEKMTDSKIAEYFRKQGTQIAANTVGSRLNEYYRSQRKERPRVKPVIKDRGIILSEDEILEIKELRDQHMTYPQIVKIFATRGKEMTVTTLRRKYIEYYEQQGKKTPEAEKIQETIQELARLKEDGKTDKQVAEEYVKQDENITTSIVRTRLRKYYKAQGKKKPRVKRLRKDNIENTRKYDDDLKQILMTGMTVQEFISSFEENEQEEAIVMKLKKLKVIAEGAKRIEGKLIPDDDFIAVLNILQNSLEDLDRYISHATIYTCNGVCKNTEIDLIKNKVFKGNTDLMMYVLSRMGITYSKGYDMRVHNILSNQYEQKIDQYLNRLYSIEDNRKKSKTNGKFGDNTKTLDREI